MSKNKILLIFIILLSLFLRIIYIGNIPNGVSNDEASLGYNAFSILTTAKDEHGEFLPVSFRSFGEYKAPLYIYSSVPFISFLGLSSYSIRLPSIVFGVLTIIFLYYLVFYLTNKQSIALSSSFILAISPWHLQYTRIAYEGSLTLLLLVLATLLFIKGVRTYKVFISSMILFGLSMYSHFSVRLFVPLFVVYLILIYKDDLLKNVKHLLFGLIAFGLILLPLLPSFTGGDAFIRAKHISLITDPGLELRINEKRFLYSKNENNIPAVGVIFYNKATEYTTQFVNNYLSHFNPVFLIFTGDGDPIFNTPYTGPLLISFIPLLVIGLFQITKYRNLALVTFGWLILSPIPSSLTRLSASTNRAFIMLIPLVIIIGIGLNFVIKYLRVRKTTFIVLVYFVFLLIEYMIYLNNYYTVLPFIREHDERVGSKEAISYVIKNQATYDVIYIDDNPQAYIQYLFYTKYPAAIFQKEAELSELDEFGFGKISAFGKFKFSDKVDNEDLRALFVSRKDRKPDGFQIINKVITNDGNVQYEFFENQ